MKKIYLLLLTLLVSALSFGQTAIITGYVDSPCSGALGRTVEIYVDGTVDFTGWNLVRQSNGGGYTSNISISTLGSLTNTFAYITNDATILNTEFGINTNVVTNSGVSDNGDDAFQLVDGSSAVIDRFGFDGVDGTGTAWEHEDTYYYRVDGTPANGGTFNVLDFTYGALQLLDGQGTCNGGAALSTLVPFGTYSTTASTTPTINVSGAVSGLDYFEGNGPSNEDTFTVSGINLTADINVAAPTNFEISLTTGSGFGSSVTVTQSGGTATTTTVYARLISGLSANTYNGDVTASSTGATSQTVALSGTVSPATPQITIGGTVNPLNYTLGNGPSNEDSFGVSGLFLTTDITVTAPTNFEVSLTTGSGFGPSVTVPQTGGTAPNTTVYVRLAAGLGVNAYSGDVTASSTGASNQTLSVEGNVYGSATNSLVITGAFDGPLTGGTPKGVEIYVLKNIADLSLFGISSVTNGGGSNGSNVEFTFPAGAVTAGTFIYVASEAPGFTSFFGFAPTYTTGVVNINGDDAIELYENGQIIDTFGTVDCDPNATGTTCPEWDHLDGWGYRNSNTGPDGTFVLANWTFSGPNNLENGTTNAACTSPFPIGTYMNTLSVNDLSTSEFKIYPNPTSAGFVNITSNTADAMAVTVYDVLGKKVLNETVSNNRLNVSTLNSGIYIMKISQNNATVTKKLVIK